MFWDHMHDNSRFVAAEVQVTCLHSPFDSCRATEIEEEDKMASPHASSAMGTPFSAPATPHVATSISHHPDAASAVRLSAMPQYVTAIVSTRLISADLVVVHDGI